MKKLKHDGSCKEVHPESSHEEWELDQENLVTGEEAELEELVDYDGSVVGSKIPLGWENNKTISATKTMDATIPMSRQSGEQGRGYFFRRFWGESVEELGEEDMSPVLGKEETEFMSAAETIEYFTKEHGMEEDEAAERAESMGKTLDLDKKSNGGTNFQRIVEDDEDVIKMLEIILTGKDEDLGVQSYDEYSEDTMLDRKIRHLKKYMRTKNIPPKSIINRLMNNE